MMHLMRTKGRKNVSDFKDLLHAMYTHEEATLKKRDMMLSGVTAFVVVLFLGLQFALKLRRMQGRRRAFKALTEAYRKREQQEQHKQQKQQQQKEEAMQEVVLEEAAGAI